MVLSVAPIGSCRIVDPLRKARSKFGFVMNRGRSFGFTHSSPEAVQQLKFFRGEVDIPEAFWPCVSNVARDEVMAQTHSQSDIYVVELSSEKQFQIDGTYLQLNYFTNQFSDFFSDTQRKNGYRRLIEKSPQTEVTAFLKEHWSGTPQKDADSEILGQVRCDRATEDSIRADIRYLRDALPRLLFVTHVNAVDKSGNLVDTRSRYIDLVKLVARQEGCAVYDPTYSMQELGQSETLEADINHFTESFKERVVEDMFNAHLQSFVADIAAGDTTSDAIEIVAPFVAARLANGTQKEKAALREWVETLAKTNPALADISVGDDA